MSAPNDLAHLHDALRGGAGKPAARKIREKAVRREAAVPSVQYTLVGQPCYGYRQEQPIKMLTKDIKPIYVCSAARFKRASESATLSCSCFDPKCSHIHPHHTGEKVKSQPNETCVVELGSAVQVR
jgi:hypothetical protein